MILINNKTHKWKIDRNRAHATVILFSPTGVESYQCPFCERKTRIADVLHYARLSCGLEGHTKLTNTPNVYSLRIEYPCYSFVNYPEADVDAMDADSLRERIEFLESIALEI